MRSPRAGLPFFRALSVEREASRLVSTLSHSLLLSFFLALTNVQLLPCQNAYALPIMAGISNRGANKREPYVTAGDRTYLIGTQDGNFPDMGGHEPGGLGGLCLHPIKLLDRVWATAMETATNQETAL